MEDLEYTLADHVHRLRLLQARAVKTGQMGAAIKAEENVGKVLGFYTIKHEVAGPGGGPVNVKIQREIIDPLIDGAEKY